MGRGSVSLQLPAGSVTGGELRQPSLPSGEVGVVGHPSRHLCAEGLRKGHAVSHPHAQPS